MKLLEPVVGKNKVSANVNVDLDFDSKKTTTKTIDPNKVIVSQQTTKETSKSDGGAVGGSTVDNNLSNTIEEDNKNVVNNKESQTTNYESGNSESTTISSPGEIKRMTASIFINDGALDEDTREQLEKAVASAIGIDTSRGDEITLLGMDFDTAEDEAAKAQVEAFNNEVAAAKRNKLIMWAVIGGLIVIAVITAIVLISKKRNEEEEEEEEDEDKLLDVVIDDPVQYKPIELNVESPQSKIENEIKNYAKEKPDQVADIVKSWLTENER